MSAATEKATTPGDRIRKARDDARLTQVELGLRLGESPARVCDWERGRRVASLETLYRIAVALQIRPATLDSRLAEKIPKSV